jgi:hypothetical protein
MKSSFSAAGVALLFSLVASAAPQAVKRASRSIHNSFLSLFCDVDADKSDRSTLVTVKNGINQVLSINGKSLDHGEWSDGQSPPDSVPAGAGNGYQFGVVSFQAESDGVLTGDEGYATYCLSDNTCFKIYFDNPQTEGNSYSCGITGPAALSYTCDWTDGAGNNAALTFTLSPIASNSES